MKKRKMQRPVCSFLAALFLLFCAGMTVRADEEPDLTRTGSITVEMKDSVTHGVIPGGKMTLFRVGDIREEGAGYGFVLTDEFAPGGFALIDPGSAGLAKELSAYAGESSMPGMEKEIDTEGKVCYSDLESGLYLLVQSEAAGGYEPVNPFLVTLPMPEGGAYSYDVDAAPKTGMIQSVAENDNIQFQDGDAAANTVPESSALIQTGQLLWPIPVLSVSGLILLAAGWLMYRKGKNHG